MVPRGGVELIAPPSLLSARCLFYMPNISRRRLLTLGGSAALGGLGGCESFYQSALLRNPVYDTSAANEASHASAAIDPPSASTPALPALFDDIERRTFDFFW